MTADYLTTRFDFALGLAKEAGALALGYFRNRDALTIKSKGLQDLVSEADLNTELLIRDRIETRFPDDAFLGEETGLSTFSAEQGIWVVDPIDGTQPFISGLSNWCVSIAFVKNGEVEFGVVFAPERDELFAGGRSFPATLNGKPMPHHPGQTVRDGITAIGYSHRLERKSFIDLLDRFLEAGGMFFRDGSGAMGLCYVAAGRLLGYLEPHINSWDCLAGIAIIRANGLKTSDFLENDGLTKGNYLIAANEAVYAELHALYFSAAA